jgi:hypothetical protein
MSPERAKRRKSRIKWTVAALLCVIAAAGITLGAYLYFHSLQEEELRNSLIISCEKNGNPLRQGLREEKEAELIKTEHPDLKVLEALHLTEAQAVELSKPEIAILKKDIDRYAPVNCQDQYK